VADLRGKTAAIAGFGGTGDLYLRYWLTKAGLDPKTDLKITFVPFHLTLPSLINRQIDIGLIDSVLGIKAQQQYPGQLKTLFTYVDVTKDAIGNTHTNALLLLFGNAFVERDRETATRFLTGYLRTIKSIHADPKAALNQWAEASRDDAIRKLAQPVTLPDDGKVYLDAFQFEADMARKFGYLKQAMDVKTAVDNSLIDEAAARLK
jgi:ABC-type nitrate/sulfonate/bicarbonate transport system substrate-binding protein